MHIIHKKGPTCRSMEEYSPIIAGHRFIEESQFTMGNLMEIT
jgi:hypothetical protein